MFYYTTWQVNVHHLAGERGKGIFEYIIARNFAGVKCFVEIFRIFFWVVLDVSVEPSEVILIVGEDVTDGGAVGGVAGGEFLGVANLVEVDGLFE